MTHIANLRYVVRGIRDKDGRRWAIFATHALPEAQRVLDEGVVVDDQHWSGTNIHDRREALTPEGGWGA